MKYTIHKDLVVMFEEKMKKFASKFEKYGTCEYLKSEPYVCLNENSPRYLYELVDIDVNASYKVGDYSFVASLEWVEEAQENLIKKISEDIYVPEIYKTRRECDHCKAHRQRKSTILLMNSEGNYIQVGKSCVKDYIGIDIGNYARYLSFFDDLDSYLLECEKEISYYKREYEVDEILSLTLEDVKRHGYISKQQSIEKDCDSTAYKVFMMITDGKDYSNENRPYVKYSDISITENQIKEVKEFFFNLQESENDYYNNIKTILQSKWVNSNNIALVVSAVGTKIRIENLNKERIESKSQHISKIGDKISFISKPECIYTSENTYGMFRIYKMIVGENEIIWKTNKYLNPDIQYEFSATIKNHIEYKGVKQTEITRARTEEI